MSEPTDVPRRHTPQFQVELDALIDRLNTGEAVVRSDVGWQLRSSILRLGLLAIPAAWVAWRFLLGGGVPGPGFLVLGALVLVAVAVEALVIVRKVRGRPTFTMRREGFALDGGGVVPWTHVAAILPEQERRAMRGQAIRAYVERGHVGDVVRRLPWGRRLRHAVGFGTRRVDQGAEQALLAARFVVLLRHPADPADVVADLANFLRSRAGD